MGFSLQHPKLRYDQCTALGMPTKTMKRVAKAGGVSLPKRSLLFHHFALCACFNLKHKVPKNG
jgi:hypothetical protein